MQIQQNRRIPMLSTHSARIRQTVTGFVLLAAYTCFSFAQNSQFRRSSSFGPDDAFLPSPVRSASTVPTNGDVNPYGVAFVPNNFKTGSGPLRHGDILVSNFNNKQNLQGTGTTIVRIPASGAPTLFYQGTAPLGLSTGLGTLQYGFVLVANLPTTNGMAASAKAGSLLVINNQGKLIQT